MPSSRASQGLMVLWGRGWIIPKLGLRLDGSPRILASRNSLVSAINMLPTVTFLFFQMNICSTVDLIMDITSIMISSPIVLRYFFFHMVKLWKHHPRKRNLCISSTRIVNWWILRSILLGDDEYLGGSRSPASRSAPPISFLFSLPFSFSADPAASFPPRVQIAGQCCSFPNICWSLIVSRVVRN